MTARFIYILLLLLSGSTTACNLYAGTNVIFEKNSASITAKELTLLNAWAEMIKSRAYQPAYIEFGVNVDSTEQDIEHLGRMRELAVRLALIDLNIVAHEVYPSNKIYALPGGSWGTGRDNDVKRVVIQYVPVEVPVCVRTEK